MLDDGEGLTCCCSVLLVEGDGTVAYHIVTIGEGKDEYQRIFAALPDENKIPNGYTA